MVFVEGAEENGVAEVALDVVASAGGEDGDQDDKDQLASFENLDHLYIHHRHQHIPFYPSVLAVPSEHLLHYALTAWAEFEVVEVVELDDEVAEIGVAEALGVEQGAVYSQNRMALQVPFHSHQTL